jgi:hypothetical protein
MIQANIFKTPMYQSSADFRGLFRLKANKSRKTLDITASKKICVVLNVDLGGGACSPAAPLSVRAR